MDSYHIDYGNGKYKKNGAVEVAPNDDNVENNKCGKKK